MPTRQPGEEQAILPMESGLVKPVRKPIQVACCI
jgi:hypothetical protein